MILILLAEPWPQELLLCRMRPPWTQTGIRLSLPKLWPQACCSALNLRCIISKKGLDKIVQPLSVQFSSVAQSCTTLCDPMNRSTPGLPVRHQCPEFTQTHVHRVGDAIQPSHPLLSPSLPASLIPRPQSLPASESFPMSQLFA